jgi:hypothetical protein
MHSQVSKYETQNSDFFKGPLGVFFSQLHCLVQTLCKIWFFRYKIPFRSKELERNFWEMQEFFPIIFSDISNTRGDVSFHYTNHMLLLLHKHTNAYFYKEGS